MIKTRLSHGNIEYTGQILLSLMKQLHLDKSEFDGVVTCAVSKEKLKNIYQQRFPEIIEEKTK